MSSTFKSVPFSPGPWRVRQESGSLMNTCFVCAGEAVVCKVASYASDTGRELPNESNADLIAAAPDLLAALKSAVTALEECSGWSDRQSDKAYAAIAKATGETLPAPTELDLPPTCSCECPCEAPVSESGDVCEACAHGTHWTNEEQE